MYMYIGFGATPSSAEGLFPASAHAHTHTRVQSAQALALPCILTAAQFHKNDRPGPSGN